MKKRILSIVLTLCLVMGLCSVGAAAETNETEILILNGGELHITPDGYTYYGDTTTTVSFTGDYILGGHANQLVFGNQVGSINVTFHEFGIISGSRPAIYFDGSNTAVNLTIYGMFYSHSYQITDSAPSDVNNKIIVDFAADSYIYSGYTAPYDEAFGDGVSFTDTNGNLLENQGNLDQHFIVMQSDARISHYATTTKGENGCVYACDRCDIIDGTTAPHTHGGYRLMSDTTCEQYCAVCDNVIDTLEHDWKYTPVEGGHTVSCGNCKTEFEGVRPHTPTNAWIDDNTCGFGCSDCGVGIDCETTEHTYENGVYRDLSAEGCSPVCDVCQGFSQTPQPHDYSTYWKHNNHYCYTTCSHCGRTHRDENESLVLTPHEYVETIHVAANDLEEEYTELFCEHCGDTSVKYNKKTSIVIDMPTYYYEDGDFNEMGGVIVYRNGELWQHVSNEVFDQSAFPFDPAASYVFKVLPTQTPETALTLWLPGTEEPVFHSDNLLEDGYGMYDTLYAYNVADYTALQAEMNKIPEDMSGYTKDTALAVANAVKKVKRMLPASQQNDVDAMTKAIKTAVENLKERSEEDTTHGVVHLKNTTVCLYPEAYDIYTGDTWEYLYETEYQGDYVIFGSRVTDLPCKEAYSNGAFWTYGVTDMNVDLVNVWSIGEHSDAGLYEGSSVNLTLFGNNVIADGFTNYAGSEEYAGITVQQGNAITIDGAGSLLALGQDNCAGIGGSDRYDSDKENAGTITIKSGTVFALSAGDAAGIGGGYKGKAGNIIIDGGTIYATCLHDDGPGIGAGEDGEGGKITINGGHVTAFSYDDDGAGIGSGDKGHCDTITINGGVIIAGSEDGAAIGGGSDDDGYGGKITINGGLILPHKWHDEDEWFIGNGNESSTGFSDDNFVKINGGVVVTTRTDGIYPLVMEDDNQDIPSIDIYALKDNTTVKIATEYGVAIAIAQDGIVQVFAATGSYTHVGDVDCDGEISAADALNVLKMLVGKMQPDTIQKFAADVDTDGVAEAADALEILKFVVGKPSVLY